MRSRYVVAVVALWLSVLALPLAGCGSSALVEGRWAASSEPGRLPTVGPAPTPTPLPPIRFPEDEAPHRNLTEWWYYTGHLRGVDAGGRPRDYGFELTFFQTLRGQLPPHYSAHFAVSDLTRGQFRYAERAGFVPTPGASTQSGEPSPTAPVGSANPQPPTPNPRPLTLDIRSPLPVFDLALEGWRMRGAGGHDRLEAAMEGYGVDLSLADQLGRPVLHGGDGIVDYGDAGFSYYYSRPLLAVSGTVLDHGVPVAVTGRAWMDHQWGDFVSLAGSGWDWYSVQLDDQTEYMLYVIRDADKRPLSVVGTAVGPDGLAREIPASDVRVEATGSWTSPVTGGVYPSGWRIAVPSLDLSLALEPALPDQELVTARSTGVAYWEGAVRVRGQAGGRKVAGEGYVELTGYATIPPATVTPRRARIGLVTVFRACLAPWHAHSYQALDSSTAIAASE